MSIQALDSSICRFTHSFGYTGKHKVLCAGKIPLARIRILIPTAVTGGPTYILTGHRQDGGRAKLAKNLRASPFIKERSNETTLSLIFLVGQYL